MRIFKTPKILILISIFSSFYSLNAQTSYGKCVMDDGNSRYEIEPLMRSWQCRHLTYYFINGTADISGDDEQNAIRNALTTWSAVTNIDFLETCTENDADLRIEWATGDHGDPCEFPSSCYFDGPGLTLAHAWYPPEHLGAYAGDIHFDDAETWKIDGTTYDLESVALHEIGHSLGLAHSYVTGAVMDSSYSGVRRSLSSDDIAGIQSIYGARKNPIIGSDIDCGTSSGTFSVCAHNNYTYTWSVPSGLTISSGQGSNQINVAKSIVNQCGYGAISVTMASDCDNASFSRNILYPSTLPSTPYHSYIINNEAYCCYDFGVLLPNQDCYYKFHWVINGIDYYSYGPILKVCLDPSITNYFVTTVAAINDCGEGPSFYKYLIGQPFLSPGCSSRSQSSPEVNIFPNPATDNIIVNIVNMDLLINNQLVVSILNWQGKTLKKIIENSTNFSIPTSELNIGQYFLSINSNYGSYSETFVIIR